ncbi:MAG TPA: DUF3592 domain-containing protein [Pseudonocardia sp.]|nr:DUF3592 domain-containing protein [Pseudonocardia sp.]
MTSTARAFAELTAVVVPVLRSLRHRLPEIVAGIAVLLTLLGVLALVGAAVNDAAIEDNSAVATAEVLEGSTFSRTLVRFTVANGQTVVPERGVYYPRGLEPGQEVAVEYDVTDPERVRVAGRSAADGVAPILGGVAVVWVLLGPIALWLHARRRRATRP